ncbi:ashwin-like [Babylonia areolata]|uniref:ashwin-like n=1 Tax=Babylonia areolata TaxID=304850 RepID=UPI003FD14E9A
MATSMDSKVDCMFPELLSKEGLLEILSQRFVKLPDDLTSTSRDDLLELYYQFIIPRPQRKYRQNRRGRDMLRKQVLQNKKRRITGPDTSAPPVKKAMPEPSRQLTSFEGHTAGNRLKPPPSCVNFDKKVIKLGGSRPSGESHSPSAGQNNVSDSSASTTTPPSPRIIKLNRTSSGDAKSPTDKSPTSAPQTVTLNKTIKLINSHLSGSGNSAKKSLSDDRSVQPMETDSPEPEKKVKIKKISWP